MGEGGRAPPPNVWTDRLWLRFKFKEDTIGKLNMTPDWAKWLWMSPEEQLNVTVIEFSPTALKVLSQMRYARLFSTTPQKTEKITIFEYEVVNGTIVNVIRDRIQYKPDTKVLY